ncbi:MAG: restriction endonuclease subunit S [Polyangiaceae bacterium]
MSVQVPLFEKTDAQPSKVAAKVEAAGSRFDVKKFTANFDTLAESADGVSGLRRLIVDLAVRGSLTSQVEADGSAAELYERIQAKRQTAGLQGRSMRAGERGPQSTEEPFHVPANWSWITLGEIAVKLGAGSTPLGGKSVYKATGVMLLRSQNVYNDGLRLTDVAYIEPETHLKMSGTHVEPGDILLNITGASIGRTSVVPDTFDEGNVSQHVAIVRLADKALRRFVHLAMTASYFQDFIMAVQVGVSREGLSMKKLQHLPIPLPPLAEQERIVAKVDQLMALCDDLEARQTKTREVGTRLTRSALEALTTAEGFEDFDAAWTRVIENFATIIGRAEYIQDLRQSILDLATVGRMTTRDRRVEPRGDKLPSLPDGWRWAECASLCDPERFITYGVIKLGHETPDGVPTLRSSNVRWLRVEERGLKHIARDIADEFRRTRLRGGEVVVTVRGTLGGVAVVPSHLAGGNISREVAVLPFRSDVSAHFMSLCIASSRSDRWFASVLKGIAYEGINISDLKRLPLPVPPLAEQLRIVAKVEQLMKLCDDLETKLRRAEDRAAKLVEAVVQELVA